MIVSGRHGLWFVLNAKHRIHKIQIGTGTESIFWRSIKNCFIWDCSLVRCCVHFLCWISNRSIFFFPLYTCTEWKGHFIPSLHSPVNWFCFAFIFYLFILWKLIVELLAVCLCVHFFFLHNQSVWLVLWVDSRGEKKTKMQRIIYGMDWATNLPNGTPTMWK